MKWIYHKTNNCLTIKKNTKVNSYDIREILLVLIQLFASGNTDYKLFFLEYGCDLLYDISECTMYEFYHIKQEKWFFTMVYKIPSIYFKVHEDLIITLLMIGK